MILLIPRQVIFPCHQRTKILKKKQLSKTYEVSMGALLGNLAGILVARFVMNALEIFLNGHQQTQVLQLLSVECSIILGKNVLFMAILDNTMNFLLLDVVKHYYLKHSHN